MSMKNALHNAAKNKRERLADLAKVGFEPIKL